MLENSCLELMPFLKWNSSFKQVLENFPLLIVLLTFAHFLPKLEKISHFKRCTWIFLYGDLLKVVVNTNLQIPGEEAN